MRDIVGALLYVVVCSDTHTDDEISVHTTPKKAVMRAESHVKDAVEHYGDEGVERELTDSMRRAGWIFYTRVGECCSVHVESKEVQ